MTAVIAPNEPLVSIVIAAFNAEATIEETCRAALAQTYASIEVLVVDDGSTDATAAMVLALADRDPRLRLIRQHNRGVAAARNAGIAAARGELLAPLDADDLWAPGKIAAQVSRLAQAGADTALVYCWWAWIDEHGFVMDRSPPWRIEGRALQRLVEINVTGNASVPLFRRSVVVALGGYRTELKDAGCQGCEDWDLVLRVAEKHRVAVVPAVLVGYRRRGDSMSTQDRPMQRSHAAVLNAIAERNPSISAAIRRRSQGQFALYLAGVAFWRRDLLRACRWGLRTRPWQLMIAVLPYVIGLLIRRSLRTPVRTRLTSDGQTFDLSCPADPMIPYDRLYARHWRAYDREPADG
jgi:glycosyltransferase involved in cell wall biosynthesis